MVEFVKWTHFTDEKTGSERRDLKPGLSLSTSPQEPFARCTKPEALKLERASESPVKINWLAPPVRVLNLVDLDGA